MRRLKKTIAAVVVGLMVCSVGVANASELNNGKITGMVTYTIVFTPEEARLYKASMVDAMNSVKEEYKIEMANTEDQDKVNYYMEQIKLAEEQDVDALFESQSDGMVHLNIPHLNSEVYINGKEYRTDKDGYYSIDKVAEARSIDDKEHTVLLSSENVEIAELDVEFDIDKESNDIKLMSTFNEYVDGMIKMSENMMSAETQIKTYDKVKVGSILGNGTGRSMVYKDKNIVGCNKHDKNLDSINRAQFALQNSDCSKSVKLGAIPALYPYSFNCVKEAVASIDGKGNAYCNGTSKMANGTSKGSHINCSWFKGIAHTEEFHTH